MWVRARAQALQRLVSDAATLRALPHARGTLGLRALPQHWSADFFLASACLELQENMEALSKLQRLSHVSAAAALLRTCAQEYRQGLLSVKLQWLSLVLYVLGLISTSHAQGCGAVHAAVAAA